MVNTTKPKKTCVNCKRHLVVDSNFYKCSNSPLFPDNSFHICIKCLSELFKQDDGYEIVMMALHAMNKPFIQSLYDNSETVGNYFKQINSLHQYSGLDWGNSDFDVNQSDNQLNSKNGYEIINKNSREPSDNQDKNDVLKMLGYDPFEYESEENKPHLYSMLVNFLDESTLEDGFKLQAVVEIVTGFNQIDKINRAITSITSDTDRMSTSSGGMKTLAGTKKDILASLMKLAEENGISIKHNHQKSKGAGTLSGIIKALSEKGVEQAELNLFDVETAEGMRQVADISNQSIVNQLQFDENDYTQMLMEQRDLIQELDNKYIKLEEDNRKLRKELMKKGDGND